MIPTPGSPITHTIGIPRLREADIVTAVGDNSIDIYPATGMSSIGGCAPNVAVRLRGHGIRSEFIGRLGDDSLGHRLIAGLREQGVLVDRVAVTPEPQVIGVLETDERGLTHIIDVLGDATLYRLTSEDFAHLAARRHVHLKEVADIAAVCEELNRRGISHSYDYSDYFDTSGELEARAARVSFFSCGAGAAGRERAAAVLERALRLGAEIAIATLGADGSVGRVGEREVFVGPEPTSQVDSIGAGDAYTSAVLAGLLRDDDLESAMRKGSAAGAAACRHVAAWPQRMVPLAPPAP